MLRKPYIKPGPLEKTTQALRVALFNSYGATLKDIDIILSILKNTIARAKFFGKEAFLY